MSDKPTPSNPPAFPRSAVLTHENTVNMHEDGDPGMTLRDYFAAKAMQAILGCPSAFESAATVASEANKSGESIMALLAYKFADAMLAERERSK